MLSAAAALARPAVRLAPASICRGAWLHTSNAAAEAQQRVEHDTMGPINVQADRYHVPGPVPVIVITQLRAPLIGTTPA